MYKEYHLDNYNLYLIPSDRFKTIAIGLNFRAEDSAEDSICRNMLRDMLLSGNGDFEKISDYNKESLNLYNPSISINNNVYGKTRSICLGGQFVNEKYTEKGMNKKSLKFILDTLYNPKVEGKGFDKKTFEIIKHNYLEGLKSYKDHPQAYSRMRLFEELAVLACDSIKLDEAIKIAESIDEVKLYEYYKNIFETNSLDIFVTGCFDSEEMYKNITSLIKGNFVKKGKSERIVHDKFRKKTKEIIENTKAKQSNLAIGLKIEDMTDFERKYVSTVYIGILGGSWNSKLMQVVREKHSLCYSIYATKEVPASLAYIYAGIDYKNYDKTLKLIKEQTTLMKKGDFTKDDILEVQKTYHNALIEIEDSQFAILNTLTSEKLTDTDSIETRHKMIDKVTKKDIMAFAEKVHYDIIYLLKGENDNE